MTMIPRQKPYAFWKKTDATIPIGSRIFAIRLVVELYWIVSEEIRLVLSIVDTPESGTPTIDGIGCYYCILGGMNNTSSMSMAVLRSNRRRSGRT